MGALSAEQLFTIGIIFALGLIVYGVVSNATPTLTDIRGLLIRGEVISGLVVVGVIVWFTMTAGHGYDSQANRFYETYRSAYAWKNWSAFFSFYGDLVFTPLFVIPLFVLLLCVGIHVYMYKTTSTQSLAKDIDRVAEQIRRNRR